MNDAELAVDGTHKIKQMLNRESWKVWVAK
jgi:hypothetical protein